MSQPLKDFIVSEIAKSGFMHMGDYMSHALCHPQHGYYMQKDPFGIAGDFITAPEISQIFGELLGAWMADVWDKMGHPPVFTVLECGPGRGTLMSDMLRVAGKMPGFLSAARVCFLEVSPTLRGMQQSAMDGIPVQCRWVSSLEEVSCEYPVIVIGNEFFDALPVRQLEKIGQSWSERVVSMVGQDLAVTLQPAPTEMILQASKVFSHAQSGDVVEISLERDTFLRDVIALMDKQGGAGLFIDYGHDAPGTGDTLQAVHAHEFCGVLDHMGGADLSSHVDFSALIRGLEEGGASSQGVVYQGQFLKALGGDLRAAYLKERASDPAQKDRVMSGYERLIDADQMGQLFKVIGWTQGYDFALPGF